MNASVYGRGKAAYECPIVFVTNPVFFQIDQLASNSKPVGARSQDISHVVRFHEDAVSSPKGSHPNRYVVF